MPFGMLCRVVQETVYHYSGAHWHNLANSVERRCVAAMRLYVKYSGHCLSFP